MKILLIFTGKTSEKYLHDPVNDYLERIRNYFPVELKVTRELRAHNFSDYVILLDEKGQTLSSVEFARFIQGQQNKNVRKIVFVVGGAFGFAYEMYQRANMLLSLSKMTFTHQMVRLILVEQLYRACTILRGEPYHH
jgi:23S rRNA (pseudouridine1915-N3)-methyltransferase